MSMLDEKGQKKSSIFNLHRKKLSPRKPEPPDELQKSVKKALESFRDLSTFYNEITCFVIFIILQIVVSTGNYSGYNTPTLYGDFEAQRHWMEITVHVPITQWYVNTKSNNLTYWGLDYPPLTAYHSWLLGKIAQSINPQWVALFTSRGIEEPQHKLFMRLTVIFTMSTLYALAIFALFRQHSWKKKKSKNYGYLLLAVLGYPGLIFVDNGHFQYNHISLGLFLWSIFAFRNCNYYYGSVFFVLSLNFKQMELYHALPIFVFLLSKCLVLKGAILNQILMSFFNVLKIGAVVLMSFVLLWTPFLTDLQLLGHVLRRIFPIYRGVFEDKVANFWCCFSVIYKVKEKFSNDFLALISTAIVLVSVLPSLLVLFKRSTEQNFYYCLAISSLSFYLFSFQVHEKSILIAVVPVMLLFDKIPKAVHGFLSISLFSLYPLCIKDQMPEILPLFITYHFYINYAVSQIEETKESKIIRFIKNFVFCNAIIICFLQLMFQPSARYPHLFVLFNAIFSFIYFLAFFVYLNFCLIQLNFFKVPNNVANSKKKQL